MTAVFTSMAVRSRSHLLPGRGGCFRRAPYAMTHHCASDHSAKTGFEARSVLWKFGRAVGCRMAGRPQSIRSIDTTRAHRFVPSSKPARSTQSKYEFHILYALAVTVCAGKTPCFCGRRRLNRRYAGSCGTPLSCEVECQTVAGGAALVCSPCLNQLAVRGLS